MKFTLQMDCDNAAFEDHPAGEVRRILQTVVEKLGAGHASGVLSDANGNVVGSFQFEP